MEWAFDTNQNHEQAPAKFQVTVLYNLLKGTKRLKTIQSESGRTDGRTKKTKFLPIPHNFVSLSGPLFKNQQYKKNISFLFYSGLFGDLQTRRPLNSEGRKQRRILIIIQRRKTPANWIFQRTQGVFQTIQVSQ